MSMDDVFKTGGSAGFTDAQFEVLMKERTNARNARNGLIAFVAILVVVGATIVLSVMAANGVFNG